MCGAVIRFLFTCSLHTSNKLYLEKTDPFTCDMKGPLNKALWVTALIDNAEDRRGLKFDFNEQIFISWTICVAKILKNSKIS